MKKGIEFIKCFYCLIAIDLEMIKKRGEPK